MATYQSKRPYAYGTGRRKSSTARVHLIPNGSGSNKYDPDRNNCPRIRGTNQHGYAYQQDAGNTSRHRPASYHQYQRRNGGCRSFANQ